MSVAAEPRGGAAPAAARSARASRRAVLRDRRAAIGVVVPPELGREQPGDRLRRGRTWRRGRAAGPACGGRARRRACGPSRPATANTASARRYGSPGTSGSPSAGSRADEALHDAGLGAVPRGRGARRSTSPRASGGSWYPAAPMSGEALRAAAADAAPSSSWSTWSMVSSAMARYVVSLPPVIVTTPRRTRGCRGGARGRRCVRSLAGAQQRTQPGPGADDVGLGERLVDHAVDRARAGTRCRRRCTADRRVGRRSRCRWCRCRCASPHGTTNTDRRPRARGPPSRSRCAPCPTAR